MRKRNTVNTYNQQETIDFKRLGSKAKLSDNAVLDLGLLSTSKSQYGDIDEIVQAIERRDFAYLREVSNYYFDASGVYGRLCRYMAYLLTFDWMVTPYIVSDSMKNEKVLSEFNKVLIYLDNMNCKVTFREIALSIIKNGTYYGYLRENATSSTIQELPIEYCRSRYKLNGMDAVEFNVKYFDDTFRDVNQKMMVLKTFPKEFQKGYLGMKSGTLKPEQGQQGVWILLDPDYAVKFSLQEMPPLVATIPAILKLDRAQDLEMQKMEQELLKIVVQKMPLDKNGELIFDIDEALDMHNNAVNMLSKAIGVDILTTFADTDAISLSERGSTVAKDPLQKLERTIFNEAGTSQQLFATDGNLALEKSVANDESFMFTLLGQFEKWLNFRMDKSFNSNPKKMYFRVFMPKITIYNYEKMAKLYKEQSTLGFSKMLPAIALGQSQSSILATVHFENEILNLAEVMMPLQMSSTMSGKDNAANSKGAEKPKDKEKAKDKPKVEDKKSGRPEKPDDEKSQKTIQNKVSAS